MPTRRSVYSIMFEVLKSDIYARRPIKIKATYDFKSWLVKYDKAMFIKDNSSRGFYVAFNFIPVEIDNTVNYYKLVY